MIPSLYVCKICRKQFKTSHAVRGHQRIHSYKNNRIKSPLLEDGFQRELRVKGLRLWSVSTCPENSSEAESLEIERRRCKVSSSCLLSFKTTSSMIEIEKVEMNEAAMSLVMLSERVYDSAATRTDISMDLELKSSDYKRQDKTGAGTGTDNANIHREERSESGFDKSSSRKKTGFNVACGTVVLALPCLDRIQSRKKGEKNYKCKVCNKTFGCFQALGGHQSLHRYHR